MFNTITNPVIAIRQKGTKNFAAENDAGEMDFGPLCARTLFFDPDTDHEAITAHKSAAPGGHDSVEQVLFERTLRLISPT